MSTVITLHGGDTFTFNNEDSTTTVPVAQTVKAIGGPGDITATIIGANVDGYNRLTLEDLPGTLNGAPVNGGPNLPVAETQVAPFNIVLPDGTVVLIPPTSLAVDPNAPNLMYALVVHTIPPIAPATMGTNAVYVLQIDKLTGVATVLSEISAATINAIGLSTMNDTVTGVQGAAFDPANGSLFFMATAGPIMAMGMGTSQGLVSVDVHAGSSVLINQSVAGAGDFAMSNNTTMAYDALKGGAFVIASGMNVFDVIPGLVVGNQLIQFNAFVAQTLAPITGMAEAPDPVTGVLSLYAIDGKEVYTIENARFGIATDDYGPLGPAGTVGGLAFDPSTQLAYTADLVGNELYTVSLLNRTRSLSVFQIYISHSDSSGEIVSFAGGGAPYNAPPKNGFTITDTQTGGLINIPGPATGGDALIGARNRLIPGAGQLTGFIPYQSAPISDNSTFGEAGYVVGATITPGIVSATGTNIGEVMIAGPVMGAVNLGGNINLFYANWILTGTVGGVVSNAQEGFSLPNPDNFAVAGSISTLIALDSIGEDQGGNEGANAIYRTAFDMHVGGSIGTVTSYDGIFGNINADDSPTAIPGLGNILQTENNPGLPATDFFQGILTGFPGVPVGGQANADFTRNDDFYNPQYLGSISPGAGQAPTTVLNGTLYADATNLNFVDFYAIPLMAGQTVTAQVVDPFDVLHMGIFSPDDLLVASDFNSISPGTTEEQQFRYTATAPGVYRFAVTDTFNTPFTDATGTEIGDIGYTMTIQGAGNLAIGAVHARTEIIPNLVGGPTIGAANGDLGAISEQSALIAGGMPDMGFVGPEAIGVQNGNFRDLDGGSIGDPSFVNPNPILNVPNGSVGLVSTSFGDLAFDVPPPPAIAPTIGGTFQLTSSAGDYESELIADGNIGVIRASLMTLTGGFGYDIFHVNAGNSATTPGNIDLVDVVGDMGTITSGPHFITGPQGNVGYVRVGGMAYRDSTFGGGVPERTQYQPGESVTLTDDTGATVTITPTGTPGFTFAGSSIIPTGGAGNGTTVNPALPQLEVTAIGIEGEPGVDGGGVAISQIASTGGVTIDGEGDVPGQTVQIGQIITGGIGTPMIATPAPVVMTPTANNMMPTQPGPTYFPAPNTAGPVGRTFVPDAAPEIDPMTVAATAYNVMIEGAARVDAFETYAATTTNMGPAGVFGTVVGVGGNAELNSVVNKTTGDIVNMEAISVGLLEDDGGQIGLSQNHTGTALNGETMLENVFPLMQAHNVVDITGQTDIFIRPAIGTLIAPHGIGNFDVQGSIGAITASILGPVEVAWPQTGYNVAQIQSLTLTGGGIAPSGSGAGSNAGLYVAGLIGPITNDTPTDIRGNIISNEGFSGITLNGGSIVNSEMGVYVQFVGPVLTIASGDFGPYGSSMVSPNFNIGFQQSSIMGGGALAPNVSPITNPTYDMGPVLVSGNGGIIGSFFGAVDIGGIQAKGGFGIFNTTIASAGDGTLRYLAADGYGLRNVLFDGGASLGSIAANGNGSNVSSQTFSSDVRLDQSNTFDPYFGFMPNSLTDINAVLGTSASVPTDANTDTGIIDNSNFVGSRDLGSVRAFLITAPPLMSTNFNFANSIGTVTTTSDMINTNFLSGRVAAFSPGGNLNNSTLTVSGTIRSLKIRGSLEGNSAIAAGGNNGVINSIVVNGSVAGTIKASRKIGTAYVVGNLSGTVNAPIIGALKIGGAINGGNLAITGALGSLTTTGNLAMPGETLTITGSIKTIHIGGNLNANIIVTGGLGTLFVGQSILSGTSTNISGILNSLTVRGDVQSNATVIAALIKHKKIKGLIEGMVS